MSNMAYEKIIAFHLHSADKCCMCFWSAFGKNIPAVYFLLRCLLLKANSQTANQAYGHRSSSLRPLSSTKAIPTLKQPHYDNCLLLGPDGNLLSTIDKKRAQWYVDKGLGGECQNLSVFWQSCSPHVSRCMNVDFFRCESSSNPPPPALFLSPS